MSTPCNSLDISQAGLVKFDGTATFTGVTTTNHNVMVGAASNGLTSVAPSATVGYPLVSQGASADPSFAALTIPGGGTGVSTVTGVLTGNGTSPITGSAVSQYGVVVGGASNAVATVAAAAAGKLLQAQGVAANPAYTTATYPGTAGTNGTFLQSNGTNFVNSTALSNGQIWIGSTGSPPVAVTLTAGAGISITNSAGGITIAATGGSVVPNLTYIGSTTTNSGTAVNYTNLSSTYKGYRYYYEGIDPDASTVCVIQVSTDGGSTYDSTAANYVVSTSTAARSGLAVDIGAPNSAARSGLVDVYFTNTANATVTSYASGDIGSLNERQVNYYVPLANVNAIRFVWQSGANFTAGKIVQYGIS